jgi:hypothetical protein
MVKEDLTLSDFYVYSLSLSSEKVIPNNCYRVSVDTWLNVLNSGDTLYIGISRQQPKNRLSKHHSKQIYSTIAKALNMNIDSQHLVMTVLSDHMGYKLNEWPLVACIEAKLINDFKVKYGHEPLLQLPAPDSGISAKEAMQLKKKLIIENVKLLTNGGF